MSSVYEEQNITYSVTSKAYTNYGDFREYPNYNKVNPRLDGFGISYDTNDSVNATINDTIKNTKPTIQPKGYIVFSLLLNEVEVQRRKGFGKKLPLIYIYSIGSKSYSYRIPSNTPANRAIAAANSYKESELALNSSPLPPTKIKSKERAALPLVIRYSTNIQTQRYRIKYTRIRYEKLQFLRTQKDRFTEEKFNTYKRSFNLLTDFLLNRSSNYIVRFIQTYKAYQKHIFINRFYKTTYQPLEIATEALRLVTLAKILLLFLFTRIKGQPNIFKFEVIVL